MRVQPARIDQVQRTDRGEMVLLDAAAGGVAADLAELDPHLKVRFAPHAAEPFFAVYWESDDQRDTYLVTTVQAYQNRFGVWEGLDQRLVDHLREIDPHGRSGYDFVREIERSRERRERESKHAFAESVGDAAERTAHQLRKDLALGAYKGRIFKPRDLAA